MLVGGVIATPHTDVLTFFGGGPVTRLTTATAIASIALFAVACSDSATGVPSSLRPTGSASAEAGNPPPPPFTGDGRGDLTFDDEGSSFAAVARATASATGRSLSQCDPPPADVQLAFTFSYLVNQPGSNGFLHLNPDDESRQITIHQTDKKLDAHGTIAGPGFTFTITDATGGDGIFGSESRTSDVFEVDVTGVVTFADGSKCTASAQLSGTLFVPSEESGLF
jgi:hypothetical protein